MSRILSVLDYVYMNTVTLDIRSEDLRHSEDWRPTDVQFLNKQNF